MCSIEKSLNDIAISLSSTWSFRDWFFAVLPIFVSLLSTLIAIYIPFRIMDKQSKIALFEKRHNVYDEIGNIITFYRAVVGLKVLPHDINQSDNDFAQALFSIWVNANGNAQSVLSKFTNNQGKLMVKEGYIEILTTINSILSDSKKVLNSSVFLFKQKNSVQICKLSEAYTHYVVCISDSLFKQKITEYEDKKTKFIESVDEYLMIVESVKKELSIN